MSQKQVPISSVLVANRGEIACRIMRTAKKMGLRTIAVYSAADKNAPHVAMADDAFLLGPAPVADSYLRIDKVLEAADQKNADAIHPGYGFLSENAAFAAACHQAGKVFIGPPIEAIDLMGDKAKAKRRMLTAGVPCVPGYQGEDQSDATLIEQAKSIGFPLMVKAAAGGGGRGMRLVNDANALPAALVTARSEAENAFGSGDLILERAIINPRHVEIQVFADTHGNVIHLGERDCSVQRRHQKVLEEAPCPVMTPDLRAAMGDAAVKAAQDIGYHGAGTVEFLLDQSDEFYFLEMNTRLQVEHPVTELITGLDLVDLQIRVAQGEALSLTQEMISFNGHAIEARLYAEDVAQDFLPATGIVADWRPASGEGVRIDAGITTSNEVSPFYDPMLAKVIAYGPSRNDARQKLITALKETSLFGVTTNKKFLIDALQHSNFIAGEANTGFIGSSFSSDDLAAPSLTLEVAVAGAVIMHYYAMDSAYSSSITVAPALRGWSSATKLATPYRFEGSEQEIRIGVITNDAQHYTVSSDSVEYDVEIASIENGSAKLCLNGDWVTVFFHQLENKSPVEHLYLSIEGCNYDLINLNAISASVSDQTGAGSIVAPMHGLLIDMFVKPGQSVKRGDRLAVLEAMKMQHELTADIDGRILEIHVSAGEQVAADSLLLEIEAVTE